MAETKKVAEEKPKGPLGKLKEAVDDKEEQLMYLATLIRVIVLVWSAGILTLNYVKMQVMMQEKRLINFHESLGLHRNFKHFGVQTGGKKKKSDMICVLTYLKRIWSFLLL